MKKRIKESYVKICPKCGSINIKISEENKIALTGVIPPAYICYNCGFTSSIFPEVKLAKVALFRKQLKKEKTRPAKETKILRTVRPEVSYGIFLVKGWWKITGPIALIIGLFLLLNAFNPKICTMEEREGLPGVPGLPGATYEVEVCKPDTTRTIEPIFFYLAIVTVILAISIIYMAYFRGRKIK